MTAHQKNETFRFEINSQEAGQRIDKALSALSGDLSRSRIQALIDQERVRLNEKVCTSASLKVREGDCIEIDIPAPVAAHPTPQELPLDIVYEDADLLVINKAPDMVVHPGAGQADGTLVNALLHYCGDSLSGIGGVARPGIVHRLDKETSGLLVVAKHDAAHQGLSAQLADRSLSRIYHALVFKVPTPIKGVVDAPIGRHPSHRVKMAVNRRNGREARTFYHVQQRFGDAAALVECTLESGRTHQIRVHMESLGHPLLGDPLYGPQPTALKSALSKAGLSSQLTDSVLGFHRQALHAACISFVHPITGEEMRFSVLPPDDFHNLLKTLENI